MDAPTLYCEQLGVVATQWLNIITNLGFFVFAFVAILHIKKQSSVTWWDYLLPILLSLIGVGSLLWHTFPAGWSDYADTISIIVFAFTTCIFVVKHIFKSTLLQIMSVVATAGIAFYFEQLPYINGSLPYIFLLLLMSSVSLYLFKKKFVAFRYLRNATLLFGIGIIARSVDLQICNVLNVGTHFLWHLLVALMGYYLIIGICKLSNP